MATQQDYIAKVMFLGRQSAIDAWTKIKFFRIYFSWQLSFIAWKHKKKGLKPSLKQWFPTFLYGGTLFSYLNFRGTPIILVNNKKVLTENLSMISQFSS